MADGTTRLTVIMSEAINKNESEDDLIQREIQRISEHIQFNNATPFIVEKSDIVNEVLKHPDFERRSLKCTSGGTVSTDMNYLSPTKEKELSKDAVRLKLKASLSLSDSEIDILLGKQ